MLCRLRFLSEIIENVARSHKYRTLQPTIELFSYYLTIMVRIRTFISDKMRHKMFLLDNPTTFFKKVRLACPEILRHSWKPEKTTSPSRPPNIATKFGGSTPWVSDDWKWPSCVVCHKFMSFLCQINLTDMPTDMKERIALADGLFQCFYCIECSGGSRSLSKVYKLMGTGYHHFRRQ